MTVYSGSRRDCTPIKNGLVREGINATMCEQLKVWYVEVPANQYQRARAIVWGEEDAEGIRECQGYAESEGDA